MSNKSLWHTKWKKGSFIGHKCSWSWHSTHMKKNHQSLNWTCNTKETGKRNWVAPSNMHQRSVLSVKNLLTTCLITLPNTNSDTFKDQNIKFKILCVHLVIKWWAVVFGNSCSKYHKVPCFINNWLHLVNWLHQLKIGRQKMTNFNQDNPNKQVCCWINT